MARTETVRVSSDEKALLDDVAEEVFGTTDVAYGATINSLATNHLDSQNDEH